MIIFFFLNFNSVISIRYLTAGRLPKLGNTFHLLWEQKTPSGELWLSPPPRRGAEAGGCCAEGNALNRLLTCVRAGAFVVAAVCWETLSFWLASKVCCGLCGAC